MHFLDIGSTKNLPIPISLVAAFLVVSSTDTAFCGGNGSSSNITSIAFLHALLSSFSFSACIWPCSRVQDTEHELHPGLAASFLRRLLFCRLTFLWQHGGWNLEAAWPPRHGPSQIPTDLDLPHKAFGSQVVGDSPFERPEILPFSIYAACRILDTTPDDEVGPCLYA